MYISIQNNFVRQLLLLPDCGYHIECFIDFFDEQTLELAELTFRYFSKGDVN
jgi:hypothetical protein